MLLIIGVCILVFTGVWIGYGIILDGARRERAARRAYQDYLLRYRGGHDLYCRVCGEATFYSDDRGPVCPDCRAAE